MYRFLCRLLESSFQTGPFVQFGVGNGNSALFKFVCLFVVEVRSDLNGHYLSRKSNFNYISHTFTEGLAGKAEVGGGCRAGRL